MHRHNFMCLTVK